MWMLPLSTIWVQFHLSSNLINFNFSPPLDSSNISNVLRKQTEENISLIMEHDTTINKKNPEKIDIKLIHSNDWNLKIVDWNWQNSNRNSTNTWMQCMILKANTLNHPKDLFRSGMKSTDHGFAHPMHWTSHCNSYDVHIETHWVHVVDLAPSSQNVTTEGLYLLEGCRELCPWVMKDYLVPF